MQTNNGHHAAACGLDYFRPHLFYDTFAMRDIDGNPMIAILYPFFPEGKTRQQLMAHSTNVQVKSCWNGMGSIPLTHPLTLSISQRRSLPKSLLPTTIPRNFKCLVITRRLPRGLRSMSHPRRHAIPLVPDYIPPIVLLPSNLPQPPRPRVVHPRRLRRAKLHPATLSRKSRWSHRRLGLRHSRLVGSMSLGST